MKMNRRDFITKTVAGMGGMLIGPKLVLGEEQKVKTYDPYELVPLGKTGIKVTRVGFGTGMRGGGRQSNQTRLGKEKFEALPNAACGCSTPLTSMERCRTWGGH